MSVVHHYQNFGVHLHPHQVERYPHSHHNPRQQANPNFHLCTHPHQERGEKFCLKSIPHLILFKTKLMTLNFLPFIIFTLPIYSPATP